MKRKVIMIKSNRKVENGMIPLWSTGQDTRHLSGKAVVQIKCSANAFELKDLNVTRTPLLSVKAVNRQPAVSRSE